MRDITAILKESGPLTGKELLREAGCGEFQLWAACQRSADVVTRAVGRKFLRLDRNVEEYARLSPSIRREFYGYTIIGAAGCERQVIERAELLRLEIAAISEKKLALARATVLKIVESHPDGELIARGACFMMAGDVVYGMSHAEPRPEPSTGELVRGSDLDLIVVTDGLPAEAVSSLDAAIHREKYKLLVTPSVREEIDYIIKDMAKVEEQLLWKDFKAMVACKILHEAEFLYGNRALFGRIKSALAEKGIPQRIELLEKKALRDREKAAEYLLQAEGRITAEEYLQLFYTAEEKEEIF